MWGLWRMFFGGKVADSRFKLDAFNGHVTCACGKVHYGGQTALYRWMADHAATCSFGPSSVLPSRGRARVAPVRLSLGFGEARAWHEEAGAIAAPQTAAATRPAAFCQCHLEMLEQASKAGVPARKAGAGAAAAAAKELEPVPEEDGQPGEELLALAFLEEQEEATVGGQCQQVLLQQRQQQLQHRHDQEDAQLQRLQRQLHKRQELEQEQLLALHLFEVPGTAATPSLVEDMQKSSRALQAVGWIEV